VPPEPAKRRAGPVQVEELPLEAFSAANTNAAAQSGTGSLALNQVELVAERSRLLAAVLKPELSAHWLLPSPR
jgi:hypothetical protein